MMDLFSDGKDVLYRVKIKYEEENLRTVLLGWVWWGLSRPTTDFERYLATPTRVKKAAQVAILWRDRKKHQPYLQLPTHH
jgi:hypothetical protein